MRNKRYWIGLATAVVAVTGCGGTNDSALPSGNPGLYGSPIRDNRERESMVANATKELGKGTSAKVSEAGEALGWNLLKDLGTEENILISPLSLSTALAMTLNGAQGETQREMRDALGLGKLTAAQINDANRTIGQLLVNVDPGVKLRVANSIWAEQGTPFKDAFMKTNQDVFGARVERLDFADAKSVQTINDWVKSATEGKIESILDSLKAEDRMILLNAVYFRGTWQTPFDKDATGEADFTKPNGEKSKVAMMSVTGQFGYADEKGFRAVALPYGNGRLEMVVMLAKPKDADFRKSMAGSPMLPKSLAKEQITIKLPKFRIEDDHSLNDKLQKLGMKLAFTERADFSALSQTPLLISSVRQKTFMEVDEQGTEAAAATSVTVGVTSMPAEPKEFTADRPFYLALREKETGLVLFLGYVGAPR